MELFVFDWITSNHLTMYKKITSFSLKNVIYKPCLQILYI